MATDSAVYSDHGEPKYSRGTVLILRVIITILVVAFAVVVTAPQLEYILSASGVGLGIGHVLLVACIGALLWPLLRWKIGSYDFE